MGECTFNAIFKTTHLEYLFDIYNANNDKYQNYIFKVVNFKFWLSNKYIIAFAYHALDIKRCNCILKWNLNTYH